MMTWISPHSATASEGHSRGKLDSFNGNSFSAYLSGMSELWLDSWFRSLHVFSLLDLKEGLKAPNHSVLFYKMQCKCLSFQLKCWGPEEEVTTLFLWPLSNWIKAKRRKRKISTEFPLSFSKASVSWNIKSIYMS